MDTPERDAEFEALQIPLVLNYLSPNKIRCNSGCPRCHGSEPGCKTSDFQRNLNFILRMLQTIPANMEADLYIIEVYFMHFKDLGSQFFDI